MQMAYSAASKTAWAVFLRPGGESNPRIRVLQTLVLPLDYQAIILYLLANKTGSSDIHYLRSSQECSGHTLNFTTCLRGLYFWTFVFEQNSRRERGLRPKCMTYTLRKQTSEATKKVANKQGSPANSIVCGTTRQFFGGFFRRHQ